MFQSELIEPRWEEDQVTLLNESFVSDSAQDLLAWGLEIFSPSLYFECVFKLEDLVILEMFKQLGELPRMFLVDTGRLPAMTSEIVKRYQDQGYPIEVYRPNTARLNRLNLSLSACRNQGEFNHQQCSTVRLAEPRLRALDEAQGWVSSQRLKTKSGLPKKVELDHDHGDIIRINPLSGWSDQDIWRFVDRHQIVVNPIHEQGVRSIACSVCSQLSSVSR